MRKILICLLLIPFLVSAQNTKTNEKNGFENYIFGTSPGDYKDLVLEIDEGDTKLYTSQNPVQVNGVEFEQVNVTFCKNKLSSVTLKTKNATGTKFLQTLKETYGEPGKSNSAKGNYEWLDQKLHLLYEKLGTTADASISIYSVELFKSQNKKKKS
jgi:hypothetical protein